MSKIYVGNLPFTADEAAVRALFEQHGTVESVSLINDRETGRPRGFGFVEMSSADAARAIQSLNGKDMGGRPLKVNEAQDKPKGGGRSGGGGGYGGGGGGVAAAAVTAAVAAAAAVAGNPATLVFCHCGAGFQPRPRVAFKVWRRWRRRAENDYALHSAAALDPLRG